MGNCRFLFILKSIVMFSIILLISSCGGGGGGGDATDNPTLYSISGSISGDVTKGVTLTLSGANSATTTTDVSGNYSFTNLPNGVYTITPSLAGYDFTNTSEQVTINASNVSKVNFTSVVGNSVSYSVSGTITKNSQPLAGVNVTLSGASSETSTTNSSGVYSFNALANGEYTIIPELNGHTFTPTSRNVILNGSNITNIDFIGTSPSAGGSWRTLSTGDFSLAIKSDNTLWAWGWNGSSSSLGVGGTLGDGTNIDRYSPLKIGTDTNWAKVSAGMFHSVAIKNNGTLWAWGWNFGKGLLGDGTSSSTSEYSPVQIGSDTNWETVSAGDAHTVALKTDGTLWAWGNNACGQLGDGTITDRYSPIQIGSDNNWLMVTAGHEFTIALKTNGTLWAWGLNEDGQLGDGTTIDKHSPVQIGSDTNWTSVTPGKGFTIAKKINGTLWAWGHGSGGLLGIGVFAPGDQLNPIQIGSATDWLSVSAHGWHTLAIKTNGTLWAWGQNGGGQLGDGTTDPRCAPVQIGSDTDWAMVSAGNNFSIAVKIDGSLWGWGYNLCGYVGDGTTTDRYSPVQIGL